MKLFFFKCNTYGEEAAVCAETLEQAHAALRACKPKVSDDASATEKYLAESECALIEKMISGDANEWGDHYVVEVHEPGHVIWTETS